MRFKLFEEFSKFAKTKYYEQIKELPEQGKFVSDDDTQLEIVQKMI